MPAGKVRVAILDDHQSIIDGYVYRLSTNSDVQVVATATYGEDLEPMLKRESGRCAVARSQCAHLA